MKRFLIPILILSIILGASAVFILNKKSETTQIVNQDSATQTTETENTPANCSGKPLVESTEGPYYKTGSPRRQKITEEGTAGIHLILKGYVFDTNCKPVANAWLDFWQADGQGNYDNTGYNLRGYQYTDKNGFFRLETVVPGQYPGRTEHIHFKVRKSEGSPVITSQLFFPESMTNTNDSIFDKSLVVDFGTDPDGSKYAGFNIIISN